MREPLSRSQMLIWMGQRLSPEAPLYNMVLAFEIDGAVDVAAFRDAFGMLLESSDALRTNIVESEGVPHRRIADRLEDPTEHIRLADPAELRDWVEARARRCFRLDGRLFDSVLLELAPDRFVWFLNQHHLITDGWSTALCYRRLVEFYRQCREGGASDAREFPTFGAYVEYEQDARSRETVRKAERYWEAKAAERTSEPIEFYGNSAMDRAPLTERVTLALGAERSAALKEVITQPGVRALTRDLAFFNVFATVLFAYLRRVSGRSDLAILAPAHNRPTPDFKETIGVFIEIFPLHASVPEPATFASLLANVQRETQAFLMNAQPGTSTATNARSYDVLLNYVHAHFGDFDGLPMRSEWVHPGHGDPSHSMRLQVHDFDASGEFVLHFDLNCDVFREAERRAVVRQFTALLDGFLAGRDGRIEEVDLLAAGEREEVVDDFNRTEVARPRGTVLDAFESRARDEPDAVAVVCGERTLTYGQLDGEASVLARRIAAEPGSLVAIRLPRSPELLVSILAALKAGCAYLPIDCRHPADRVALLLGDSAASWLIDEETFGDAGRRLADPASLPEDLAYVIYTSGSTGRPKGVMIGHDALANYVRWAAKQYTAGERLRFALYSSPAFDLTVTSIFVPLTSGGTVVVYPEQEGDADLAILRVLDDDSVDVVKLTPSHLALLDHHAARSRRISRLIVGGEDLRRERARAAADRFGSRVAIFNEYGPTEATVACMIHRFDIEADSGGSVPIGRPIANARVYLLDSRLLPVPEGIVGEVCVAGSGLAHGYLGRPDLTAERFVPDPFRPGETMYRTGDLARRNAAGELVYLGRGDQQVKVRGARVELAEVEAALAAHDSIAECVVDVVELRSEFTAARDAGVRFCTRCGLSSNHPDSHIDAEGRCRICRDYEGYADRARAYFRTPDDLRALLERSRADTGREYDCLMLLSGGKDSTYALYRVVEMRFRVLVLCLDNGYISEGAKSNIRRAVEDLGLELVFASTPSMNTIFADSLHRFSNVCQGCFKTIYTLATNLARERRIPYIVTGLSRGQIFETRLADIFQAGVFDPDEVDRLVVEARKAYHRADDAVARCLDVDVFESDDVFEEVRFVDFYRYCDVELSEMLAFLDERAPWIRPEDTGRSTNCLINESGIWTHKRERGFHNYELPYSWDVRLGHKTREEALEELDEVIDEAKVRKTLAEVGYSPDRDHGSTETRLVGYFVARDDAPTPAELREYLAARLPGYMLPHYLIPLESVPLLASGKVDRKSLPPPGEAPPRSTAEFVAPSTGKERVLAPIWQEVLHVDAVGVHDDFFELGGDSILAIQIVARAARDGLRVTPKQVFDHPSVALLASVADQAEEVAAAGPARGPLGLTPIQRWFFDQSFAEPDHWNQAVLLEYDGSLDPALLQQAFDAVCRHHDALRLRFADGRQQVADEGVPVELADGPEAEAGAHRGLDIENGPVARAVLFDGGPNSPDRLLVVAHHLVVDAVSWPPLVEDLENAYEALARSELPALPPATPWSAWAARAGGSEERGPKTHRREANVESAARTVRVSLGTAQTESLLRGVPAAYEARAHDLLLAALVLAMGEDSLRVDVEEHGRDVADPGIDLSRTVGWFTRLRPWILRAATSPAETLKQVKEQLRGGSERAGGVADILFNYLGRTDRAIAGAKRFRFARKLSVSKSLAARRTHALEINAMVDGGRLEVAWTFCPAMHDEEQVQAWAQGHLDALRALIEHCLSGSDRGHTPSDFPEAGVSQEELDSILEEFGEREG